jgi:hypothetical protein
MEKLDLDKIEQAQETDHCGGMKHCKNRMCNPADVDCRECLDDSEKAIEEAIRNRGNPNWP